MIKIKKITLAILLAFNLLPIFSVSLANAQGITPPVTASEPETIKNPIKSETFFAVALHVMQYMLAAIAGIAVVFIMFGGVELMISQGNQEMVTRGKETIVWALLGLVAALFAFSLVAIVQNFTGFKFSEFIASPTQQQTNQLRPHASRDRDHTQRTDLRTTKQQHDSNHQRA
jgi:magnesium-transporting ATPase (P-type)